MNKYLPDNIDEFFAGNLKAFDEDPGENMWHKIEQQLPAKKQNVFVKYSRIAAAIIICIALPYLLSDSFNKSTVISSKKIFQQNIIKTTTNSAITNTNKNSFETQARNKDYYSISSTHNYKGNINSMALNKQAFTIAYTNNKPTLSNQYLNKKNELMPGLLLQNILNDEHNLTNNSIQSNDQSTSIKLPAQHHFNITPFFSFDHISGRFIEQYEFDNQDKNDYSKREKPDISFTGGVLAEYELNKKFSAVGGISFSASNISITSTAVRALKDASGIYKFKLATSYGLAEISQSGINPGAGDSLLLSGAAMQFNYVAFPVCLKYNIQSRKVKLSVHGGLAFNKITGVKVNADYLIQNNTEAETINKVEGLRRTFFTINTGFEAAYSINKRLDVSLSPELRYGINTINKGTPVKTYPVNYGMALGLRFKLK